MNIEDNFNNIFCNLPYDLQEKIYNETLILQETEKNKRYFSGYVLGQIKYYGKNKKKLNTIYKYLDCGDRIIGRHCDGAYCNCVKVGMIYDKLYYDNLDYILKCDINTYIDIDNDDINFDMKLKDIYSFQKKYYDILQERNVVEDNWEMSYNGIAHCLQDFLENDIDIDNRILYEDFQDLLENKQNEELKYLLYLITKRKIFYGKLDKYDKMLLG